jgi:hypothetical protein
MAILARFLLVEKACANIQLQKMNFKPLPLLALLCACSSDLTAIPGVVIEVGRCTGTFPQAQRCPVRVATDNGVEVWYTRAPVEITDIVYLHCEGRQCEWAESELNNGFRRANWPMLEINQPETNP